MPMIEFYDVKVCIQVDVAGHILIFKQQGKISGCWYHGDDPKPYYPNETLEARLRGTVDSLIAKATKEANRFITNAYPVFSEPKAGRK